MDSVLAVNPDVYSIWAHRKQLILRQWQYWHSTVSSVRRLESEQAVLRSIKRELALTAKALSERNPKSYCTWHHRMWVVALALGGKPAGLTCETSASATTDGTADGVESASALPPVNVVGSIESQTNHISTTVSTPEASTPEDDPAAGASAPASAPAPASGSRSHADPLTAKEVQVAPAHYDTPKPLIDLNSELSLCDMFLTRDERNFHCWNYRRWLAARSGLSPAEDLEYTRIKLDRNFSNYSAWHQRAQAISIAGAVVPQGLRSELERVRTAVYTEPDDQSAWIFHRWAVGCLGSMAKGEVPVLPAVLQQQVGAPSPWELAKRYPGSSISAGVLHAIANDPEYGVEDRAGAGAGADQAIGTAHETAGGSDKCDKSSEERHGLEKGDSEGTSGALHGDASLQSQLDSMPLGGAPDLPRAAEWHGITVAELEAPRPKNEEEARAWREEAIAVLQEDFKGLVQLVGLEPRSKWPLLGADLVRRSLRGAGADVVASPAVDDADSTGKQEEGGAVTDTASVPQGQVLVDRLIELDPRHRGMYESLLSRES